MHVGHGGDGPTHRQQDRIRKCAKRPHHSAAARALPPWLVLMLSQCATSATSGASTGRRAIANMPMHTAAADAQHHSHHGSVPEHQRHQRSHDEKTAEHRPVHMAFQRRQQSQRHSLTPAQRPPPPCRAGAPLPPDVRPRWRKALQAPARSPAAPQHAGERRQRTAPAENSGHPTIRHRFTTFGPGSTWAIDSVSANSCFVSHRWRSTSSCWATGSTPPNPCKRQLV